ncbi:hypothetical protein ScPMuIL_012757 [Solemya velum]
MENLTLTGGLQTNSIPIEPIHEVCYAYMLEFGKASSAFVNCSVGYSRPFRVCEECVVHYETSVVIYNEIIQDEHSSKCKDKLLKADRIQILNQVYQNIHDVWNDARCSKCFSSVNYKNASVRYEKDNKTAEFVDQFEAMNICILNKSSTQSVHKGRNETICNRCEKNYKMLNDLYRSMSKESPEGICMDVVDMMNYTRQMWGSTLKCSKRPIDMVPIIVIAVIVLLMPVIFYISNRIYGQKQYRKLMKQKRMSRHAVNSLYSGQAGAHLHQDSTSARTNI